MGIAKFGVKHQGEMGKLPVQKSYFTSQNEPTLISAAKMGMTHKLGGTFYR